MISRNLVRSIFSALFGLILLAGIQPAVADSSHARVIRLSLVQGDVRFTRDAHGDPLADQKAVWEAAQPNLPVRQGYVLSTDNGRAEVEFENGAMAFLNENTVLEFYDLSLEDGARTTRLLLRQGSASFYVNPASGDYFSVTGGDFTVEASGKSSFRVNNYDDGSNVDVLTGRASVLHKKETTQLSKGQSLSMRAGTDNPEIGRLPADDDFDHWVSGRIDTVSSANNATLQYTNSPYYAPGYGSLYTYGNWSSCGGYGFGWRPFGAGLGWSPFSMGQWIWDPGFGWTFASSQPWGWAPYHYGGWLFDASCGGWFYSPPVYFNRYPGGIGNPRKRVPPIVHPPHPLYRASTAVFVRQNGQLGVVPMHPLDKAGKTPLNLDHGVFSPEPFRNGALPVLSAAGGQKLEVVKAPPRDALKSSLVATAAPVRTPRTIMEGNAAPRSVALIGNSSISYDAREHRFVNSNAPAPPREGTSTLGERNAPGAPGVSRNEHIVEGPRNGAPPAASPRVAVAPAAPRASAPPPRNIAPPPAPRVSGGGGYRGGESVTGGGGSRASAAPSAPAPRASAPAPSSGGRPH